MSERPNVFDPAFAPDEEPSGFQRRRATVGEQVNPVYIPRNHQVEEALAAATGGDLQPFRRLLEVLGQPFEERPGLEPYAGPAPTSFGSYRTFCGT